MYPKKVQANTLWFPDSEAANHVTTDLKNLHLTKDHSTHPSIVVVNGSSLLVKITGKSYFYSRTNSLKMNDILFTIPQSLKIFYQLASFVIDEGYTYVGLKYVSMKVCCMGIQ